MLGDEDHWRLTAHLAIEYLLSNHSKKDINRVLDAIYNLCPCADPESEIAWGGTLWAGTMLRTAGRDKVLNDVKYKPDGGHNFLGRIRKRMNGLRNPQLFNHLDPSERIEAGTVLNYVDDPEPGVSAKEGVPYIEWCYMPEGPFIMGSDKERDPNSQDNETPQHESRIAQSYLISKYLVTNAQYDSCTPAAYGNVNYWREAKKVDYWSDGRILKKYWDDVEGESQGSESRPHVYDARHSLANHPVVGVNWFEAVAFCRWLTDQLRIEGIALTGDEDEELASAIRRKEFEVRLPTEAEWEKAARWDKAGGEDKRIYPWEGGFDMSKCNFGNTNVPSAVGIFPKGISPCGCLDMAGNVWEWCQSKYIDSYEKYESLNQQDDRESLGGKERRVLRGGSFGRPEETVRCAYRHSEHPKWAGRRTGFRLVLAMLPDEGAGGENK